LAVVSRQWSVGSWQTAVIQSAVNSPQQEVDKKYVIDALIASFT
jgi:hypothetical protein